MDDNEKAVRKGKGSLQYLFSVKLSTFSGSLG